MSARRVCDVTSRVQLTLYSDSESTILVVARFVRDDIANSQRYLTVSNSSANADGSLMDVKERSYTMTSTMTIIESLSPEELSS